MGRIHAECLEGLGETKLVAVHDISHQRADQFSNRFGGVVYDNLDELLSRGEVDCVYICTRHDSHRTVIEKTIKAQKPMYCEKPLAMRLCDSESIAEKIKQSRLPFMIGFNQRRSPGSIRVKKQLESTGPPNIINLSVSCINFLQHWMGKPEQGGGILTSLACHAFDLLRYITEDEIIELSVFADRRRLGKGFLEDCGVAICRFESGILASVSFHDHGQHAYVMEPTKAMFRIELHTETQSIVSHCHSDFCSCDAHKTTCTTFDDYSINSSWGYIETNRYFINALKHGERPEPNESDGLIADRLIDAARKSMRYKKAISID